MYTCGRFSDSLEYQGQTAPLEESVLRHSPWFTGQCQEKDRLLVIHAIWKIVDDRLTLHSILTDAVDEVSPIALAVPKLGMYNLEFPIAASWFSGTLTVRNQPLPGFFGNGYGWKIGSLQTRSTQWARHRQTFPIRTNTPRYAQETAIPRVQQHGSLVRHGQPNPSWDISLSALFRTRDLTCTR